MSQALRRPFENLALEYETPYGTAKSIWEADGTHVRWQVTIPANSQAVLELDPAQQKTMKLSGTSLDAAPKLTRTTGPHRAEA